MATMVARGNSPSLSPSVPTQEKGSRNKRKFRADPPLIDPNLITPSNLPENYELFPIESHLQLEAVSSEAQPGACTMCRHHLYAPSREGVVQPLRNQEADWIDNVASELEETVMNNLDMMFRTVIKGIVASTVGCTEEIATYAVLSAGLCCGPKDTVSNIVENARAFLMSQLPVDISSVTPPVETFSVELKKLQRNLLSEMIVLLKEFRPFLSQGDMLWRLLICDMDVSTACALDMKPSSTAGGEETKANSAASPTQQESNTSGTNVQAVPESKPLGSDKPMIFLKNLQNTSELVKPAAVGIPSLPRGTFTASAKDVNASLDRVIEETSSLHISQLSVPEGKPAGLRKGHLDSKRNSYSHHHKPFHAEKSHRMFGATKPPMTTVKHNSSGGLILDRKCKALIDSSAAEMKTALVKLNKAVGIDAPHADPTLSLSFNNGPTKTPLITPASLPVSNTELSLSLSSASCGSTIGGSGGVEAGFTSGTGIQQDKVDEMIDKLTPRVKELETQLQEWSDWAQKKVMQAARRLAKDKSDIQNLRQEKDEVARLKKEKQSLEENTRKKLADMGIALSKASSQVEKLNADARMLERENSELRKEMEAAKIQAAESATNCQEVLKRETETLKQFQSWERQKAHLQDELTTEKKKLSQLQQQVEQAKEHYYQLEARWKQEERAKDEAITLLNAHKKEREQIEVSGRSKENEMKIKAETDLQRYKDTIRKHEQQIARLRQKADSSRIAALKWGAEARTQHGDPLGSKFWDPPEVEEVQRERECVMCLTEEMSVVFLPCAHQVVCVKCNELHEKQGMKDCPSCRTVIEKRVLARSADC